MLINLRHTTVALALVVAAACACAAQRRATSTSLEWLRHEVKRLEAVERDARTSEVVADRNRTQLQHRRAQLRRALRVRTTELRRYQPLLRAAASERERRDVADKLDDMRAELRRLDADIKRDSTWWRCRVPRRLSASEARRARGRGASLAHARQRVATPARKPRNARRSALTRS